VTPPIDNTDDDCADGDDDEDLVLVLDLDDEDDGVTDAVAGVFDSLLLPIFCGAACVTFLLLLFAIVDVDDDDAGINDTMRLSPAGVVLNI
jgi:hypothetical protein